MKKLMKSLISFNMLLLITNNLYATTGDVSAQASGGISKKIIIAIGVVLVFIVLFVGYKLDQPSESFSKTPKVKKQKKVKTKLTDELPDKMETQNYVEDIYRTANEDDVPYEIEKNESYEKDKINLSDINETLEYIDEEEESLFSSVNQVKGYDTFVDDIDEKIDENTQESINHTPTSYNDIEDITSKMQNNSFDSTMIFDTNELNSTIEENKIDILSEEIQENFDKEENLEEKETVSADDIFANLPNVVGEIEEDSDNIEELLPVEEETDFIGFTTINENEKVSEEENEIKRFTRKKDGKKLTDIISNSETEEIVEQESVGVDYNFLAEMEKTLVNNKNKRLGIEEEIVKTTTKSKKTTSKKDEVKKDEKKAKSTKTKKTEDKKVKETAKTKTAKSASTEKKTSKATSTKPKKTTKTKKTTKE